MLSENMLAADPMRILDARIDATVVAGECVYARPGP